MTVSVRELDLAIGEVADLVRSRYGCEPLAVTRLESELSTVARIDLASGPLVAKATWFSPADLAVTLWRVGAMNHLDGIGLPVGRTVLDRLGRPVAVADTDAGTVVLHLSEFLSGVPLEATTPTPDLLVSVGRTAAQVARGLADWPPPPAVVGHPWELLRTLSTLDEAVGSVQDRLTRRVVEEAAERFRRHVAPKLGRLPGSVVHHDLHDSNLLVDSDEGRVTGVLDFGDMLVGPRVAELAVAAVYASRCAPDPVAAFVRVAEGWGRIVALEDDEIDVLFEAGIARLAVNAAVWASRRNGPRSSYARSRSEKSTTCLVDLLAADRKDVQSELRAHLASPSEFSALGGSDTVAPRSRDSDPTEETR